jgi:hypothetical protein
MGRWFATAWPDFRRYDGILSMIKSQPRSAALLKN